jgi:WD40 repeat protein
LAEVTSMTDGPRDRVQELFDQAVELAPELRSAFLDAACSQDATLRAELEDLLACDAGTSLDIEAVDVLRSPLVRPPREPDTWPGPPSADASPARIGGYAILRKLGEGGMGLVYLAEQTDPPRTVALKLLATHDRLASAQRRFRIEAEATARLQHPHIVEIFEVGEHNGRPFLALEYLDGGSLDERLKKGTMDLNEAAGLIQTLARAIHFAHCQGFIHRDLKPGNILFGRDGIAKIADFGLALVAGRSADLTHSKQLLGTPSYMAPEQAQGNRLRVGPATDVYALGVILYECLTGRRPFPGEAPLEVLHALLTCEPVSPRRHRLELPRDLEAICLKCLNKDAARRYPSAWELAEDLERYRQGKPTLARPVGVAARVGRWCVRHPVPAALLASLVVVFLASFALVTWMWSEADAQRRLAQRRADKEVEARKESERLRRELARESSLAMFRLGMSQAQEGFVVQGMHWLARALVLAEDEGLADLEGVLRLNLAHWQRRLILPRTHPLLQRPILQATASPDERWVVTVEKPNNVGKVWDLTRKETPGLDLGQKVQHATFSQDGAVLMVAVDAGMFTSEVLLWRRPTGEAEPAFEPWGPPLRPGADVLQLRLSPDRQTLVVLLPQRVQLWDLTSRSLRCPPLPCVTSMKGDGCLALEENTLLTLAADDTVCRWDVRTGAAAGPPQKFAAPAADRKGMPQKAILRALSPDGRTLAVSLHDLNEKTGQTVQTQVRTWDVATGQFREPTPSTTQVPRVLTFSPDGRVLAATRGAGGREAEEVQLHDAASGQLLGAPLLHPRRVSSLVFSADNRLLITGCMDGRVRFWESATGQALGEVLGETRPGSVTLAFGQQLLTIPLTNSAKLWEAPCASTGWTSLPSPHDWGVLPHSVAALSPDGRTIAVSPYQRTVQAWDLATGRTVTPLLQHEQYVTSIAFNPTGDSLLTGCADGSLWLWELPSGRTLGPQVRHPVKVSTSGKFRSYLSPDGRTYLTLGSDEVARLWDAQTRQFIGGELRQSGRIQGGAFSRDSQKVVTVSVDGVAQVWEAKTGRPLGSVRQPAGVRVAAFSPDGAQLLTGGEDGVAQLWEWQTGNARRSWTHRAPVECAGFSPDGRTFFTATRPPEGQVHLWDRATGLPLGPALGPLGVPEHVLWVEFSPDGRRLVMGGEGSTLPRLWDLPQPVTGTARQVQAWVRERTGNEMDQGGGLLPLNGARENTP